MSKYYDFLVIYWRTVFHIIEIAAVWMFLVMASFMFRICSPLWDVLASTPVGYVSVTLFLLVPCITTI